MRCSLLVRAPSAFLPPVLSGILGPAAVSCVGFQTRERRGHCFENCFSNSRDDRVALELRWQELFRSKNLI